jgi:hypothetical protein
MPQSVTDDLPFKWRVDADVGKRGGPTYEDLEFWVPEGDPLPQEFFDFVYERAPSLKDKAVDWAYTTRHGEEIAPGILLGAGFFDSESRYSG